MQHSPRWASAVISFGLLLGCGEDNNTSPIAENSAPANNAPQTSVVFQPSTNKLANPERGFYRFVGNLPSVRDGDLAAIANSDVRLVLALVRLDSYRSAALPDSLLQQLDLAFAKVRQHGLKVVIRFAYNYPRSETEYRNAQDAPLSVIQQHLEQIAPVVANNEDVIAFFQAGFIGAWGEWHTSSNNLTTDTNKAGVRDALLKSLPAGHFLQMRYPTDVMKWYPKPLTEAAAFRDAPAAKIGLHNDCFLASPTDVGTYSESVADNTIQRDYAKNLTTFAPFGGETCNPTSDPVGQPRTSCADILQEGRAYHLTYLNREYYTTLFHDRWTQDGCMDEVERSMGYRLELVNAKYTTEVTPVQSVNVSVNVRNQGWARLYKTRPMKLMLRHVNSGDTIISDADADPRKLLPGGATMAFSKQIPMPSTAKPGVYDILVGLPDTSPKLSQDPRYAIRFANADHSPSNQAWEASIGFFRIGSVLRRE